MNELINSIVELTSQQDSDSLDASLMMTVHQLVDCSSARLHLCKIRGGQLHSAILRLGFEHQTVNQPDSWVVNEEVTQPDNELSLACLTERIAQRQSEEGNFYYIPQKVLDNEVVCLTVSTSRFSSENETIIKALLKIYANYATIINRSERDKLTGLLNRNSLEQRFRVLLNNQKANLKATSHTPELRHYSPEQPAWLALIDIDHFKNINDTYGHLCGDEVLLRLSQLMVDYFRSTDLLFRYGGEEFLIVMQPIPKESARYKMMQFVAFINSSHFPLVGQLSVSVGFTQASSNQYFQELIGRADRALYYAKDHGRNQACMYETLMEEGKLGKKASGEIDLF